MSVCNKTKKSNTKKLHIGLGYTVFYINGYNFFGDSIGILYFISSEELPTKWHVYVHKD